MKQRNAERIISILLVFVMVFSLYACGRRDAPDTKVNKDEAVTPTALPTIAIPTLAQPSVNIPDDSAVPTEAINENSIIKLAQLYNEPRFSALNGGYIPLDFTASAPEYSVKRDLSNIVNIAMYPDLTEKQREMIAENGFVVAPSDFEQLFYVYEKNEYLKLPSFITADSVLQLFHIFYDYVLRELESEYFYNDVISMNDQILNRLVYMQGITADERVLTAVNRMMGYFAVVNMIMDRPVPDSIPSDIYELVIEDYNQVIMAAGEKSALLGCKTDFTMMTVRGHYTRSEELGSYFRAMSWYGCIPLYLDDEDMLLCAAVANIALFSADTDKCRDLWERIYSATSYMVGEADDITPYELSIALERVYSGSPNLDLLTDKLDLLKTEVIGLRKAKIVNKDSENAEHAGEMRFMGQRSIPDSIIYQEIVNKADIDIPIGMDVFSVMGCERADKYTSDGLLVKDVYNQLKQEYTSRSIMENTDNAYNGWFYSLLQLGTVKGEGYPFFMKNDAWADKSLASILGSWAEIRHDTILYGKQSTAEGGDSDFDEEPEEKVYGYVEPDPEFYNRLCWLIENIVTNLNMRQILPESLSYRAQDMVDMISCLREISLKELRGEKITDSEQEWLRLYGARLESLSSSIADASDWFMVESEIDRNMAVIADVHTYNGSIYEEEAVGTACIIYVAVPTNDKVFLMRGATFDYYEFLSEIRLTDEEWQSMLKSGNAPDRPEFVSSFLAE